MSEKTSDAFVGREKIIVKSLKIQLVPVNTGRKLNVLYTFSLHSLSTGVLMKLFENIFQDFPREIFIFYPITSSERE